jgi:hypothetical protein
MKFTFWLYKLIKPFYDRLESRCQKEIDRLNKIEVMRIVEEKLASRKRLTYNERLQRSAEFLERMESRQSTCKHVKGGYLSTDFHKDYNISIHTFVNAQVRARCLSCGKVWWRHLVTTQEWTEVIRMAESSTNTPSASEHNVRRGRKK